MKAWQAIGTAAEVIGDWILSELEQYSFADAVELGFLLVVAAMAFGAILAALTK
jgi:hypothetical protein